ncbi:exopolysaccharide biosynthesis polyprenyl glycosylphosphotransferase [Devosia ginsengisoli]|uniref:Exopolysaccharide biosynthesis polyprenyl glycosylphosphotransferase n=1 Tax=Devosia ginsengisoli TaxID=400770 RepID=A0A5B8LQ17_9HYPH|nr:exopolysaccharide biosynthesis polyprenyl glycosylphosphotransferase [Devosia ginsengisoli]
MGPSVFQDSVTHRVTDMRRRRRFRVANWLAMSLGLTALEALVSALILLFMTVGLPWGEGGVALLAALCSACVFGVTSFPAARTLMDQQRLRYLDVLGAPVAFLAAVSLGWLVAQLANAPPAAPDIPDMLAFGAAGLMLGLVRWALYRHVLAMMHVGQFQVDRIGLIGHMDDLHHFEQRSKIWRNGAQVVVRLDPAGIDRDALALDRFISEATARGCSRLIIVGDYAAPSNTLLLKKTLYAARGYALGIAFSPQPRLPPGAAQMLSLSTRPLDDGAQLTKRLFDIVAASGALLVTLPVLVLVALLIRLEGGGPVLFRQQRKGFNGETFSILKFRSMRVTESTGTITPAKEGDSRITPLGRLIRRTSIDELPQLLNVLVGDMSMVGPRPHANSQDRELDRDFADYAGRRRIKPGITGWAQVNGYRGELISPLQVEGRIRHDLDYIANWSLMLDIKIIWLTAFSPTTHKNAR